MWGFTVEFFFNVWKENSKIPLPSHQNGFLKNCGKYQVLAGVLLSF